MQYRQTQIFRLVEFQRVSSSQGIIREPIRLKSTFKDDESTVTGPSSGRQIVPLSQRARSSSSFSWRMSMAAPSSVLVIRSQKIQHCPGWDLIVVVKVLPSQTILVPPNIDGHTAIRLGDEELIAEHRFCEARTVVANVSQCRTIRVYMSLLSLSTVPLGRATPESACLPLILHTSQTSSVPATRKRIS